MKIRRLILVTLAAKFLISLFAALVAFSSFVSWRAGQKEALAEANYPPEGQLLNVDGYQVHAVVMGKGPDVVLIHGASGNTRDMTFSLAPRLAKNYRVIVFDRPGLGYTDPISDTGATIIQQADLLESAALQLGATKPIVVGHSYGGSVALTWAVHHPDNISALVLVAAASNPWTTSMEPYYQIISSRLGSALVVPLITAFATESNIDDAMADTFAPQPTSKGYGENVGAGLTLRRASTRANALQRANLLDEIIALEPHYGEISVPTEIVHGTDDDTVNFETNAVKVSRQIDGAVLTRLEGVGHMPHHVAEDQVIAAIDRAATHAGLR
ncbi:MAG: pimeloyl-ACP methyl ester carboxylesterase [Paracoccaceae bacterium]|jgi:pimeloyl-ACP methyl ester carboxylesterase